MRLATDGWYILAWNPSHISSRTKILLTHRATSKMQLKFNQDVHQSKTKKVEDKKDKRIKHIVYVVEICLLRSKKSQTFVKIITWSQNLHQSRMKKKKTMHKTEHTHKKQKKKGSKHASLLVPSQTTVLENNSREKEWDGQRPIYNYLAS